MSALLLAIAVLLVGLGGLFAAAEAAIVTLPTAEIRMLPEPRPRRRRALARIADEPVEHASTAGFLRVLSETAAAVLVTVACGRLLPSLGLVLIVAIIAMTLASYVLVGVSPRGIGRDHPERTLSATARLIAISRRVIGPVAVSLSAPRQRRRALDEEDDREETRLLHLVDKAVEQDVLEQGERELIHQVVEFGDTLVRSIMVPRTDMRTVPTDASLEDAMRVLLESGYSRLPLRDTDTDDIVGVVYLRDVAAALFRPGRLDRDDPVASLARRPNLVPESKPIDDLLTLMQRTHRHLWIVIDEYGSVAGLVTLEDVIEELVGEISDEHDRGGAAYTRLAEGRYRVAARLGIDELGSLFDIDIDEDEVDTAGGLLTKALGHLPQLGEGARADGLLLTAARVDPRSRRLLALVAERAPRPDAPAGDDAAARPGQPHPPSSRPDQTTTAPPKETRR